MRNMTELATKLAYEDLPLDLLKILRRSFLDTMGVAAVGSTTQMSGIARKVAPILFGAGDASL